jgi:FkbM family methyltransferase
MLEMTLRSMICNTPPSNIIEIGSRDGHDTHTLSKMCNLPENKCYIFEAHPDCFNFIKQTYPKFNVFNCAVTNKTGPVTFNAGIVGVEGNIGMSSLLDKEDFSSNKVQVDGWRFDEICKELKLKTLDLVKIDVEGHTLEVLEGFGSMLSCTKILQLELEHVEIWKTQATYEKVKDFLTTHNFEQVAYSRHSWTQSDSVWINNNFINKS